MRQQKVKRSDGDKEKEESRIVKILGMELNSMEKITWIKADYTD